jgi:hypothetical protein
LAQKAAVNNVLPARRTALNTGFLLAFVVMGLASLPWFKAYLPLPELKAGLISAETPLAGTTYLLSHHIAGPVFNDLAFGSYLIWAAHIGADPSAYKVFVDPRLELYSWAVWKDYVMIGQGQANWEQSLDQYGIKALFLNPSEEASLVHAALQSKNWARVYQDPHSVIFIKE